MVRCTSGEGGGLLRDCEWSELGREGVKFVICFWSTFSLIFATFKTCVSPLLITSNKYVFISDFFQALEQGCMLLSLCGKRSRLGGPDWEIAVTRFRNS